LPSPRSFGARARVPAPSIAATKAGPRSDFRETIHLGTGVTTGKTQGDVTFYLSDAVTSFRVFAEVSRRLCGSFGEVVKSSLRSA